MDGNRQLDFTLSLGYVLTALIIAYFYFSPTVINPLFSDILIVLGVLLLLSCLIFASAKARSPRNVVLVLFGIMLFSILARSIPHLRAAYPPVTDPYFYAISALNIIDYGTLQPVLGDWYSGVISHLHWPVMQLFTAAAVKITGIDSMWFFRFQEPLLGGIFVLAVFALAKEATKNNTIALLAALFASASDVAITYQSEYHPQGFAVISFVLFLYLYLKSRTIARVRYRVLALVGLMVFLASHHFSSLFIALLAFIFIGLSYLISVLPQWIGRVTQVAREIRADYNLWTLIAVAGIAYHLMVYVSLLRGFIRRFIEPQLAPPGAVLLAVGADVPMLTTLLNSAKWGILLLAVYSIVKIIRTPRPNELRLLVLLVCILFAGFIATYLIRGPVDRMVLFYAPLVSVFAAMTVHKLFTLNKVPLRRTQMIKVTTVLMVGLLLTAGFFNGFHVPAFYFKSSQVNSYYWYDNQVPSMDEYKVAGEWTGTYIPSDSKIGTGWYTRTVPFFFGKRKWGTIIYPVRSLSARLDYVMFDPSFPRWYKEPIKLEYDRNMNLIYDNGEIKIYKVLR
ncbi:MAG: hypothetical protein KAV87_59580 [Desulfobacteraceae bacterium]|nr:hypothetical protein [Desulfobacteraceae bacterium]